MQCSPRQFPLVGIVRLDGSANPGEASSCTCDGLPAFPSLRSNRKSILHNRLIHKMFDFLSFVRTGC